jgi:hypothetical protein
MSIESQAILIGHLRPYEVLAMIKEVTGYHTDLRAGHKDSYKMIEIAGPAGVVEVIHLVLDSSVREDYSDVTDEPSTFMSVQASPSASDMIRRVVEIRGGFFRRSETDEWVRIDPTIAALPRSA